MGFYSKHGLNVEVIKTAGWAVVRDKTINKEYDAAHMLSPMPLAITLGAGSNPIPYTMPAVENINGQAITLAMRHKDKRDPKSWKGFKFAVPFDYSMHNYLLRYYVAEHGIDPALMHRVALIGAGTLDSLPHNGAVVTLLAVCGSTHGKSYLDIVMVAIVGAIVALAAVIVLGSTIGSF